MKTFNHEHWAIKPDALTSYRQIKKLLETNIVALQGLNGNDGSVPVYNVKGWAIVDINGVLMFKPSIFDMLFGAVSISEIQSVLERLIQDKEIKGIILQIDSPGGQVNGLVEFADWLYNSAKETVKPVVSLITGLGASGAYWIASQTDEIYAYPSALVGSIGVITVVQDISRLEKNIGVDSYVIKTGKNKAIGVGQVTDEQISLLEEIQNDYFKMFINAIERSRRINLTNEELDGRIFLAKNTLNRLVDKIGLLDNILSDYKL